MCVCDVETRRTCSASKVTIKKFKSHNALYTEYILSNTITQLFPFHCVYVSVQVYTYTYICVHSWYRILSPVRQFSIGRAARPLNALCVLPPYYGQYVQLYAGLVIYCRLHRERNAGIYYGSTVCAPLSRPRGEISIPTS